MIKLAVIGISGRNPSDLKKLTKEHMEWMAENILCYIENILNTTTDNIILVSGGSSWADHVAVQLYLNNNFAGLELYLPTRFDVARKKYINSYEGRLLNLLHQQFKDKTEIDSLNELAEAIRRKTTKTVVKKGFFQRNHLVSNNCDHLVCFIFGKTIMGGSADTWKKIKHENKIVIDLSVV